MDCNKTTFLNISFYFFSILTILFYYIIHSLSYLSDFSITPLLNIYVIAFLLIYFFFFIANFLFNIKVKNKKNYLINIILIIFFILELKINHNYFFEIVKLFLLKKNNFNFIEYAIFWKFFFYFLIFILLNFDFKNKINYKILLQFLILIIFTLSLFDILYKVFLNFYEPSNHFYFNNNTLRITLFNSNASLQDSFVIFLISFCYLIFFYDNSTFDNFLIFLSGLCLLFLFSKLFIFTFYIGLIVYNIIQLRSKNIYFAVKHIFFSLLAFYIVLLSFKFMNIYLNQKYDQERCFEPNAVIYSKVNYIFQFFIGKKYNNKIISYLGLAECNGISGDNNRKKNIAIQTGIIFKDDIEISKYVFDSTKERVKIYSNALIDFKKYNYYQKFFGLNNHPIFYDKRFNKFNKKNYESLFLYYLSIHGFFGFFFIMFLMIRPIISGNNGCKIIFCLLIFLSIFHNSHLNPAFFLLIFLFNSDDFLKYRLPSMNL